MTRTILPTPSPTRPHRWVDTGRRPPVPKIRHDINLIFKGIEQAVDRLVYATFFAGPAAVILVYNVYRKTSTWGDKNGAIE